MPVVLGLNTGHNASAALLKDGEIVSAVQEERIVRLKNYRGFPSNSVNFVLSDSNLQLSDIDLVVYSSGPPVFLTGISQEISGIAQKFVYSIGDVSTRILNSLEYHIPPLTTVKNSLLAPYHNAIRLKLGFNMLNQLANSLQKSKEDILYADHHTCHAFSSVFGFKQSGDSLIFTLDGEGEGISGSVSIFSPTTQHLERLSVVLPESSLGLMYAESTKYLGMKAIEDEYKVMGLAPYSDINKGNSVRKILNNLVYNNENSPLTFDSKIRTDLTGRYLHKNANSYRFDQIALGVQSHLESIVSKWVSNAISLTNIRRVYASGGVFMNVKLNLKLSELNDVNHFCPFPSGGDESNSIGAAYYGFKVLSGDSPNPLKNLYLGQSYSDAEIEKSVSSIKSEFKVEHYSKIEDELSDLLSDHKIVARFCGKMEFGSRALGNRSILSNPSDMTVIRDLNLRVKKRDFWMPFAPSILAERVNDYMINPGEIDSPYMNMAFHSTDLAQKDLIATIHPYDHTLRPQILSRSQNPRYYDLIKQFEAKTGIGGILNTSFNLHGDPIVCTPEQAINTLRNSGLEYLSIGDYLISKS